MSLPPGVTERDFNLALRQFELAVGREWVFTSDEDVALYRDAYSPFWNEPEDRVASAAVAPQSVEEVQAVVRAANEYRIPIYPISTGRNLGYGGSAPNLSGSVVLDLKRMNRVLEVDDRNHYAVVEPGVSYFDFYRHIQERGLKVWIDCPDPGWGSVIGNALDRGGGYTLGMYRNHFEAHCGIEVVLANGEVLRTGMGAMPGAKTWQQYRSGVGPYIDGLFSQSNFGVVTKMGFWLMPEPEAFRSGVVGVPRHADLVPLVDTLNYLENTGQMTGMPFLGSPVLSANMAGVDASPDTVSREPPLTLTASPEDFDAYTKRNKVPAWTVELRFYGAPEVVDAQWAAAKRRYAAAIPGATFTDLARYEMPLSEEQLQQVHKVAFGIPNLSIFSLGARSEMNPTPTSGHVWFSPIVPRTGEAVFEAQRVLSAAVADLDTPLIGLVALPSTFWTRAFIFIIGFPISHDVEANRKVRAAFEKVVRISAEHGWGEYRTAPAFQDLVMSTYSHGDHVLRRFNEALKDAVDPNGIISAGRYGIWPRHLRKP
ncbi:MAG: FAD-binding oxidoreductase [Gammaproteobacteria bacterium]|nr:FAD-binding oxidoreductase [Gammaproteobacteria bacterium]